MTNQASDLGSAFGQSAAALRGKLPPKQPPPPPQADTTAPKGEPAPKEELGSAPAPPPPPPERPELHDTNDRDQEQPEDEQRHDPQPPPAKAITYQVSVYLLPNAVQAAERIRKRDKKTNADIALDALDAVHNQLTDLVVTRQTGPGRPANSLFPSRRGGSTRTAAAQQGRRQLWSMQATITELNVIDRLCEASGAVSRSELISVAVEAHLTPSRRRSRLR